MCFISVLDTNEEEWLPFSFPSTFMAGGKVYPEKIMGFRIEITEICSLTLLLKFCNLFGASFFLSIKMDLIMHTHQDCVY